MDDNNDKWFNFEEIEVSGAKMLFVIVSDGGQNPRYYPIERVLPYPDVLAQLERCVIEPPL